MAEDATAREIRLLLVDDHPVVRDGLRGMCEAEPGFTVVGEAADGEGAVRCALATRPDVVLMDLRMPGAGGVAAIAAIAEAGVAARVLVLTTYDTDHDITASLDAGATGYLLKDSPRDELVGAIRAAAAGRAVVPPAIARRVERRAAAGGDLSPRELGVLALVAQGRSNRDIAAELFVSEATVKTHLSHVYEKLGVPDRAAAVSAGYQRGLLGR